MTGAAITWCFLAVSFGSIGLIYGLVVLIGVSAGERIVHNLEKDIARLVMTLLMIISSCYCAKKCSDSYDVKFAIAMKNLDYQHTVTTETSVRLKPEEIVYPEDKN